MTIKDCISTKVIKNTGQLPKVLILNRHEPIISREIFDAAQEETTRRNAVAASTKKSAPTLDERPLQQAVLAAVNAVMSRKGQLINEIADATAQELAPVPGEVMSLADIDRAMEELSKQFDQLMEETNENISD